ncbi:alpha/beta-hydrolase [Clavulina sp. PMI_390]|nr:alpha/beta-hydrolase [Clavulina sp. PMI_390]
MSEHTLKKAPFGTWKSPITADILTQKAIVISDVLVDGVNGTVYHTEDRPYEAGRVVPVMSREGKDVVPAEWNARTKVHEYGGACTAVRDGIFYFSDGKTGRLFKVTSPGTDPVPVSPDNSNFRFGAPTIHPTHKHLVIAVFEDHTKPTFTEVVNKLVCINTSTSSISVLAEGADFYSFPTISPDGTHLAFVQWRHPNMPWDATELCIAKIVATDAGIELSGKPIRISAAGATSAGAAEESISNPLWISPDSLVFLSDVSGFWNPWIYGLASETTHAILKAPLGLDFSESDSRLGDYRVAALTPDVLVAAPIMNGKTRLSVVVIKTGELIHVADGDRYVHVEKLKRVSETEVAFVGFQDAVAAALVSMNLTSLVQSGAELKEGETVAATFTTLKTTSNLSSLLPSGLISPELPLALPNPDPDHPLHILFALPDNPEYDPAGKGDGEKPPCVVHVHGGPTTRDKPGLKWLTQYFTSRGWAFCSVNFRGSTGYGRAYRTALLGQWGVVDVHDCATAARALAESGRIDGERVVIRGGSGGGYAVLQALTDEDTERREIWKAGANLYGISDLKVLAEDTHKFESHYGFGLLGGTAEEVPQVYRDRSLIHFAERITAPLLILQGSEDHVVPPNQAEMIVTKIKERLVGNGDSGAIDQKVKYIVFEGEGHGWRKSQNVKRGMQEELMWYERVFSLETEEV